MATLFTKQIPGVKKIAILGREDVFPKAMASEMKKGRRRRRARGRIQRVLPGRHPGPFGRACRRSRLLTPQWIFVTGYTQDLILARKQMGDLKLSAPIVTMITGPSYREFIDGLGKQADGVTSASWWHHTLSYKSDDVFGSTDAFYKEFLAREKRDPDYVHASSAASLIVLQKAIEKAGTLDKAKVRDALAATDIDDLLRSGQVRPQRHEPGPRSADHPGAERQGGATVSRPPSRPVS